MAALALPIAIAATAVSAIGQIQAGRAQASAYRAQAKQAEIQGKQAELQYKQQGVAVLERINQNLSTVTARAAAGGMDPYSGSALSLQNYAQKKGAEDYYLTEENAALQMATAEINSQQYRNAASQAVRQGWISAISTVGTAAMTMGSIGGAPASGVNASTGAYVGGTNTAGMGSSLPYAWN